ncbi:inner membrane protein [Clostridium acetobutylicum]|uniref:Predicted metal-dependent membrane hydrolase n=1 Tax=Clostridium acetobutylicum (strain ATCC 824 / DSM 792 / JCM 1419 / IAM 19013 / LMG 5710 / NBRC 13948 / NRRL B-527 / VKM B-1787 / 2291 / W) TaxID=272562 RepID=Q97LP7_CLOAB|nr:MULTISPECIES: metal-dependent hydrolase [Clostridium]AAK78487.1 Predicted metal-dependent membrane hydrolase [Clostridium acetobutylicum ATCC 824]ADZ19557.1 metal-dependent membrane hydrolase [Clostridium acetobutylicum EA 2018]AEI31281.1 metal-dependent membrane hydrolase [Clostridium acetobutylicum DSM 1731]AWV80208.1 metal-dependent hydrolase [Clostridium acetobutylicum]MBC2392390.1 metal-dependent hydrolase [Clostridium acetobutylicum]
MTGKTHAGIGAAVGIALAGKLPGGFNAVGMGLIIAASILPDIDHPKGMLNQYILPIKSKFIKTLFYGSFGALVVFGNYYRFHIFMLYILGALLFLIAISSHRNGLMHSAAGMIVCTVLVGYVANRYNIHVIIYYFMAGYGLHLLCDMSTSRGIPLLYPFKKKNYKFSYTFRVGSAKGTFIENFLIILSLLYIIYRLPVVFKT